MPTRVIMPALGLSQDTGRLLRWLAAEGSAVVSGQAIAEIETDKVTTEIQAPASGVLAGLRAQPGEDVPVGQVIGFVLAAGEAIPAADQRDQGVRSEPAAARPQPPPIPAGSPAPRPLSSPKARRLAQELGVDLTAVRGSGASGEITVSDVMKADRPPSIGSIAQSAVWRRMAERVTQSWTTAPHFYVMRNVSARMLVDGRREWLAQIPSITHTDLIIAAVAKALRQHPQVNASWLDGAVVLSDRVNIGVVVATEAGLVVPVVRQADELGLAGISQRRHDLVTRAHAGRLRPDDLAGGTFTISNLGMHGVDAVAPILNSPQAAILGIGRIADRVIASEGAAVVCPMMTLTLSCDHRAIDGVRAAQFLETLAQVLQDLAGITL